MKKRTMKLSNKIKERRIELGISGYRLAQIVKCHSSHIYKVESGHWGVSDDMAKRLAEALGTKVENLFYIPSSDSK